MKEKVALFDLDGTLAGYAEYLAVQFNKIRHPSEPIYTRDHFGQHERSPDFFEARRSYITSHGEFWEALPELPDGFRIFDICNRIGFTPMVLTQGPATKPEAWSHKLIWCQKHLPGINVTMTRDKGLVYGRVLVDDWPEYAMRWLEHRPRGLVVMPARPWNASVNHPNIVRADDTNIEEVDRRLVMAWNRE